MAKAIDAVRIDNLVNDLSTMVAAPAVLFGKFKSFFNLARISCHVWFLGGSTITTGLGGGGGITITGGGGSFWYSLM